MCPSITGTPKHLKPPHGPGEHVNFTQKSFRWEANLRPVRLQLEPLHHRVATIQPAGKSWSAAQVHTQTFTHFGMFYKSSHWRQLIAWQYAESAKHHGNTSESKVTENFTAISFCHFTWAWPAILTLIHSLQLETNLTIYFCPNKNY